jgi:hypothetical protein
MKHAILFGLVAVLAIGAFAGCRTVSDGCDGSCGCMEANCCSWDFYKPCDLIEGRIACECPDPCGAPAGPQGIVYERSRGQAIVAPAEEEIEEVIEEGPAEGR